MSVEQDLWEAKITAEVEKRVASELKKKRKDPEYILQLWLEDKAVWKKEKAELSVYKQRYEQFLDADGYIDAGQASAVVRIDYLTPAGNVMVMGRNYFLDVLRQDGIILKTVNGYRLSSRYEKDGLGITRVVDRNGYINSVVLFNSHGVDRLIKKYERDGRIWHSTTDHQIYSE